MHISKPTTEKQLLVRRLRIYAMSLRLKEIIEQRIQLINIPAKPMVITPTPPLPEPGFSVAKSGQEKRRERRAQSRKK